MGAKCRMERGYGQRVANRHAAAREFMECRGDGARDLMAIDALLHQPIDVERRHQPGKGRRQLTALLKNDKAFDIRQPFQLFHEPEQTEWGAGAAGRMRNEQDLEVSGRGRRVSSAVPVNRQGSSRNRSTGALSRKTLARTLFAEEPWPRRIFLSFLATFSRALRRATRKPAELAVLMNREKSV